VGHGHGNGAGARKHLRGLERTVTLNGGVSGVHRPVRGFYRTSRYGLVGPILRTSLCASSARRRCPWLEGAGRLDPFACQLEIFPTLLGVFR
jgi:hypothetical protein